MRKEARIKFALALVLGISACFVPEPTGTLLRLIGGFVAGWNIRKAFF